MLQQIQRKKPSAFQDRRAKITRLVRIPHYLRFWKPDVNAAAEPEQYLLQKIQAHGIGEEGVCELENGCKYLSKLFTLLFVTGMPSCISSVIFCLLPARIGHSFNTYCGKYPAQPTSELLESPPWTYPTFSMISIPHNAKR